MLKGKRKRSLTRAEAIFLLLVIIVVIFTNSIYLKLGTGMSVLSVAIILAIYSMIFLDISWDDIMNDILNVFQTGMGAILILLMVGLIGSSWTVSGTVPMLINYGLELISPKAFLVISYLLCGVLGIATGSAWAIIGSVGLALMGVGQGLGVPAAQAGAAIAIGAYIGDMWSPFSDVPNLTAASTTGNSFDIFKVLIPNVLPSIIISVIFFTFLGFTGAASTNFDNRGILEIQNALSQVYNWNILLIIPPIIVIAGAIMKYPTIPVLTLSALVAVLEAVFIQKVPFSEAFNSLYVGTSSELGNPAIDKLLTGGGLTNMMDLILIIFCAFIFAGILESSGLINVLLGDLSKRVKHQHTIIIASLLTSILTVYLTASVYVAVIINARVWNKIYLDNNMSTLNNARVLAGGMSNWGLMVPWSGGAAVMMSTFGLSWYQYAPYMITTYVSMLLIIIFGVTKKFIIPPLEEEVKIAENN